jgi:diguanylate cyclase (GGDEF)-like protein
MVERQGQTPDLPGVTKRLAEKENIKLHTEQRSITGFSNWSPFPKTLGQGDLALFMILIVVLISNTNSVQFGGPSAFVYWLIGLITFLLPYAFVTQWLTHRYPGEGAPYLWIKRLARPHWTFILAFYIWIPGVLTVISVINHGLILSRYLLPGWFVTPLQQGIGIICLLIIAMALACLPLRRLKDLLGGMAILYLGVFVVLGSAGIWWLISGRSPVVASGTFTTLHNWLPSQGSFPLFGVVVLAFLGVNIPLLLSAEVHGGPPGVQRASRYVWWGSALAFLAYFVGTFSIMVIIPGNHANNMTASVLATQAAFGPLAGDCIAIVLFASQMAIAITYILIFARVFVFVARDRRLPARFGSINRYGVPVYSIIWQSSIAAAATLLIFIVIPVLFGSIIQPLDLSTDICTLLQAGTEIIWVSSIIELFILALKQLYRINTYKGQLGRQQLIEQILLTIAALVGIGASLISLWYTISRSWIPHLIPDNWWMVLVIGIISLPFMFGWLGSDAPRMQSLLGEQRRINTREKELREELMESYKEQQLLVEQQQILLAEVGRLYHEQSQAAVTDAVTGLPNHRAIMSRLGEEIAHCQQTQGACAILFVDLDQFKLINDTWGHRAGDAILHEIGARLRSFLRQEDFVGRYGGEEFAIVLSDADVIAARFTAERLRQAFVNKPCKWLIEDSQVIIPITVTASIGIAVYGLHGLTREELVEYADRGMYQAKHAGRNCVCIADVTTDTYVERWQTQAQKRREETVRGREKVFSEQVIPAQTVQALIAAVSAHDPGINNHAYRIMKLAKITARKLQMPEEELPLLYLTALFHDIGKIGIPDAILHKPGPLTDDEWVIMHQHPEIGRQILVQTGGIFQQVATSVAAHHERWDGHGYPNRLAGVAIPLSARIICVIDAYETMTERRAYHEPRTIEEARAELERCAGSQFDPQVVKTFLSVLEEGEQKKLEATFSGTLVPSDLKTIEGEDALLDGMSALANDLTPYAKSRKR